LTCIDGTRSAVAAQETSEDAALATWGVHPGAVVLFAARHLQRHRRALVEEPEEPFVDAIDARSEVAQRCLSGHGGTG
jgi:hypothetical protein